MSVTAMDYNRNPCFKLKGKRKRRKIDTLRRSFIKYEYSVNGPENQNNTVEGQFQKTPVTKKLGQKLCPSFRESQG